VKSTAVTGTVRCVKRWFFAILLAALLAPAFAAAHPTLTNGMEVVVHPDRVAVRAKISLAQIDVAHTIDETGVDKINPAKLKTAMDTHGPYLLAHLRVTADDVPVQGRIASATPPPGELPWAQVEQLEAVYDIDYPLPKPRPATVRIEQDLLKEFSRLGQPWVALFIVQARLAHEQEFSQLLLTRDEPLEIACQWDAAVATTTAAPITAPAATTFATRQAEVAGDERGDGAAPLRMKATSLSVARSFAVHGFEHIITGYDHLLFVAALVLAATQLWDLVKVVTAFAVAHTLTLTLSVLDLVRLPSSIVEPVIAASIVFVALQNVVFPRQSRGAARLAIAFAFGLFHGLGFAGGLLEAMEGMPAINLAVALLAFTLGVEAAHQALIVPLYFLLKPLRRSAADAPADPQPRGELSLRLASLAISLAGAFYLVQALRGA
jgi:hydrogenase/urease accessory protein HupE